MPKAPRDYSDLFLAPVALDVDLRLEGFAALDRDVLHKRVCLETNHDAWNRSGRAQDVVDSVTYLLEMHGWRATWDPRGIRLSHDSHSLVLGVPPNVAAYVAELTED